MQSFNPSSISFTNAAISHFKNSLNGIKSENDLMSSEFGSYGEENKKWSSEDAKGFIKIISNQNKIYQYVNNK